MTSHHAAQMRSGLPRTRGGEPWPPGGVAGGDARSAREESTVVEEATPQPIENAVASPAESAAPAFARAALRRGLPRNHGGDPWPAAAEVAAESGIAPVAAANAAEATRSPVIETAETAPPVSTGIALRRGLPRVPGGEAWPAAGQATATAAAASPAERSESSGPVPIVAPVEDSGAVAPATAVPEHVAAEPVAVEADQHVSARQAAPPAPRATPEAEPAAARPVAPAAAPTSEGRAPRMIGSRSLAQWTRIAVWGILGAVAVAGIIVLAARGVTTLPGVPEFLARFPGEYHPPVAVEEGFPAWARWTHFLNFFFMVLIVRTGLLVRYQQKPPAFYTPKKGGKKISLYLWLHTSLDILWLLNGAVFVALLFVTNHWVRIVPTSWEVFPNALSAALQYLTLEWPTENGWVNYNSLQQLMYFTVVFIAAPLAAVTGVRMSEWWPERAKRLNRIYPAPVARALHFPVMLFFVLFVIVHVFLVLATGALRNLNHMFAGTDQVSWAGFWWFAAALFAAGAVSWLARPLVLAPIANLFGRVSNR